MARVVAETVQRVVLVTLGCCMVTAAVLARDAAPAAKAREPAAAKLSAGQIIAKNIAARGGLDAWRKIQTMVWIGHIESAHAPVPSVQFTLAQERPNKARFEVNAMGEKTARVFNGARGWKLRDNRGRPGVQPFTPEEARFEQGGPGIDGVLIDYADKGSSVEVAGVDDVDKGPAYHLILRTASGETQHVWVDAKTFLETRYDRPVPGAAGASRTVSVAYRNYKTFEGVKIPSVIETVVGTNSVPDRMVIERVLLNPRLDAHTFSEPGAHADRSRAAGEQTAFPPHRPSGVNSLPAWLRPTTPVGPPVASPSPAPATPAEAGPPQPDSSSASSRDRV
jgi:hypothetical protein